MGQNIKPSKRELAAMADALLRSKRPPDPKMVRLQKLAEKAEKKKHKAMIFYARRKAAGTGRRRSKANKLRDEQKFGKLGPASEVRHIEIDKLEVETPGEAMTREWRDVVGRQE